MTGTGSDDRPNHGGGCLCGAVRYRVRGALREVIGCHCRQCRRTSGHYVAATRAAHADFELERDEGLRWYTSSPGIRRGFCGVCGASLFWQRDGADAISIMAGTFDGPIGVRLARHIHTATAGDYYSIDPALPQATGATGAGAAGSDGAIPPDPEEVP